MTSELIGTCPRPEWRRTKLKYVSADKITTGVGEAAEYTRDDWPRYVRTTDIEGPRALKSDTFYSLPPEVAAQARLRPGDIVLTTAGSVGTSYLHEDESPACYAGYLARLRPREDVDPRFLIYWTQSVPFWNQVRVSAVTSTIDNVAAGKYQDFELWIPSCEEQRSIANYLDEQVGRLNAVLDRNRAVSDLVAERMLSKIFRSVTGKGADEVKPSGVWWLGEVPSSWSVPRLGYRYEIQLGKMLSPQASEGPNQAAYLRNVNVQWDHVNISDLKSMSFDDRERQKYSLQAGDLLVCEGGEVGRTAQWRGELEECFFQKAVHRVRPRDGEQDESRFLFYLMRCAASLDVFEVGGNQSTIAHLTAEKLRDHRFPFPSRPEQIAIVEELDNEKERHDRVQETLDRQHRLLTERREALITAAVSGQIDVTTAGRAA